jgi:hypothetical protein
VNKLPFEINSTSHKIKRVGTFNLQNGNNKKCLNHPKYKWHQHFISRKEEEYKIK